MDQRTLALLEMTTAIVTASIERSAVPSDRIPAYIGEIFGTLSKLDAKEAEPAVVELAPPAVNPKKSVTPDFIICLEDGKKFKSLKRHIQSAYGLTPEAYRAKWGLAEDYPMVAPNYATARSALAKASGLGRRRLSS